MIEGSFRLLTNFWLEGRVPGKWNGSKVSVTQRSIREGELKNYRSIVVLVTFRKTFNGLLSDRMKECCGRNRITGEDYDGFLKDRRDENYMLIGDALLERKTEFVGRCTCFPCPRERA